MTGQILTGIQNGIEAGLGVGLVTFAGWAVRSSRKSRERVLSIRKEIDAMETRLASLEGNAIKDKMFKQTLVGSQVDQLAILRAIVALQTRRCDGCPVDTDPGADGLAASAQKAIDDSSRKLTDYLGSLA